MSKRTAYIHLGPHKTGTTAIQDVLRNNSTVLFERFNLTSVDFDTARLVAKDLNAGTTAAETESFRRLRESCNRSSGDVVLSCEDLSGELPGRNKKRRIYPKLFSNIKAIRQILPDFDCRFLFFVREPEHWLESAYGQVQKYPTWLHSFDQYRRFLKTEELWDETLRKPRIRMGSSFTEIEYAEEVSFDSVDAFFKSIIPEGASALVNRDRNRKNKSPSGVSLKLLEAISRSGASGPAQRTAKEWLRNKYRSGEIEIDEIQFPAWPTARVKPEWLDPAFEPLWRRSVGRIERQEQPNLLPDPFCDLLPLREMIISGPDDFPKGGRDPIENQDRLLRYRLRGLPETCALHGLVISYLRRETEHTEHAAFLFQRLWHEEYAILLGSLPTRWLISAFQTFCDHGANEAQRVAGAAAFYYSNMIKAYEAERAMMGVDPDEKYEHARPSTKSGFPGMDRFGLGSSDLILNSHALLLELAAGNDTIGRAIQELLLRTKNAHNVATRMDQNRLAHDVDAHFDDSWSFRIRPAVKE